MVEIIQQLQKDEKIEEIQQEVANVTKPSFSIEWVRLLSIMEHLEVFPTIITMEVKKEIGQQILDNKITTTTGQLLKLVPDLNIYLNGANKQFALGEGSTSKSIVIVIATIVDH
jgi:hypothetical protein